MGARKSFLREPAAVALAELLKGASDAALASTLGSCASLQRLLYAPPAEAQPEGLELALRLWARMPAAARTRCMLLPAGAPPPPVGFWEDPAAAPRDAVEPAAGAVLSTGHLRQLVPVLLASSAAHPRLHGVWGCLLALLLPGFKPQRVSANDG